MVLQSFVKLPLQTRDLFIHFSLNERAGRRKKRENYLGKRMMMIFVVKVEEQNSTGDAAALGKHSLGTKIMNSTPFCSHITRIDGGFICLLLFKCLKILL